MSLSHSPSIVRTGLSLLFDPANIKSYPGTGTTIYDLSGNGNHGTLSGSPVFTNGYMVYDGVNDAITVTANQNSLDFSQEQTVIIWMYHTYTSGRKNPYDQAYGGYGTWTHEQGSYISLIYGNAGANGGPYTSISSGTTPLSTWNCVVLTRSVSTAKAYINGVNTSTGANPYGVLATTTANINFGIGYAGVWVGNMGPMMLYKRALSADEVQQNFEAHRGRYGV
jgi:hypothetical protein